MTTNPVPPPDWMLPDFDANSVKVSDLRSILLENNIPHSYTKKADLVQLFERQVKPMTAKLLKDHQSVKPSAVGIFDMRTGQYITEDPPATTTTTRTPRKKASSIDQESLASTASKPRTRRSTAVRDSSAREQSVNSEANGELTPQANPPRSRATRQRTQRESTQPDSSPEKPARRLGKRKASEQPLTSDSEVASEIDQLAHLSEEEEASNSSHRLPSSSINVTNSSVSPAPIKKRRSELPTQSTPNINPDHQQEPALPKKSTSKPKHRRSTIYEAIEAGEGSFSDFNPFQTAPEEDNKSGSGSKKSHSSNRQSSVKRSSIAPAHLPRSSTTPNIFNVTSSAAQPNLASQQVPPSSHMSPHPHPHAAQSFLPKSVTMSNVHSLQTPARESIRKSGPFPSLPSNRRLTMTHLQDDFDGNVSFDQGNPEHIQQLLVPEENQTSSDGSILTRPRYSHVGGAVNHEIPYQSIPTSVQSRRQSQLPPRTPYAQSLPHSSSNLQYETPLPRPQIQRVKLDELVHTSPEKRLKITKPFRRTLPKKNGPFAGPTQVISFLLRLGCLGLMFGAVNWYLRQTERLGYCDTGMKSNAMTRDQRIDQFLQLDDMSSSHNEVESFADTFRAKLGQAFEAASAFGLLPDCQSCPAHAICERGRIVRCELDFVQTHTDWEKRVHRWLPMLMGPKCLPDTAKLVKIVERANQLNHLLKKQRGKVLCSMGMRAADEQQSRAVKINVYGLSESHIKDVMISKSTHADEENQKVSSSSWSDEEIVELAIKDLERTGQVVRGEGYLATRDFQQMEMGLQCRVKLGVLKTIQKFKLVLMSAALLLAGWLYIRLTFARLGQEKQKVRELVELALTKLRDESWVHHTNPALSPDPPTLASAQLRDLILSYDHSPVNRQKLWKKVEKIVEGNSNVRTKVSEIRGESIKVWEWIGNYKANLGLAHLASTGAPGSGSQPFNNSPDAHPPPPSS
ncbi:hypothetical protein PCANC_05232 [Puccinia coronata f. sp. avenae]|uniref:Man1/Src1 C-terminal domain-containing protein n=1 Tax=Puccinia coronata f. sp. avenae TaxID=200324 RepID=A0A2N5UHD6_9BASI|nr:hypothetical protein PCASD_11125 [Puccinia coronata f. sp. avenae]PLW54280.1 hypothetical protein PCANC_05232 [Puccinia coronata f. sp. avenae]